MLRDVDLAPTLYYIGANVFLIRKCRLTRIRLTRPMLAESRGELSDQPVFEHGASTLPLHHPDIASVKSITVINTLGCSVTLSVYHFSQRLIKLPTLHHNDITSFLLTFTTLKYIKCKSLILKNYSLLKNLLYKYGKFNEAQDTADV